MRTSHEHYLESSTSADVLVLTVAAPELRDGAVLDGLRQELLAAVARTGRRKVVLDLGKVKYFFSPGLSPLLSLRRKLGEAGGRLVLCNLSPDVLGLFQVSRLIRTSGQFAAPFTVAPDVPAAVALLNPGASRRTAPAVE
jgi:stage II sporulation protein AA (anti-sigma F factor antagonist)